MDKVSQGTGIAMQVDRASAREMRVTRVFNAPVAAVFAAWAKADLFRKWWIPRSSGMTILACEMDVRTGGNYRLEIAHPEFDEPMTFFGRYIDVVANERIVWTNEEGAEGAVTTVTFAAQGGKTVLTLTETYPSAEALEQSLGAAEGLPDQLDALERLLSDGA